MQVIKKLFLFTGDLLLNNLLYSWNLQYSNISCKVLENSNYEQRSQCSLNN